VSATVALMLASRVLGRHPKPRQVEDRLKATAVDGGVPGFDPSYGWGRVDAAAATDPAR
jgi:serine protease